MMVDPARSIPVLASLDISETRDFYVRHLDKRDEMEIHFLEDPRPALFEEFQQRREPQLSPFEATF